MKRRLSLLLLLQFVYVAAFCQNVDMKKMYQRLDGIIANSQKYVAQRESRINHLRQQLKSIKDTNRQYEVYYKLYTEYQSYKNDSAIAQLQRCIRLAEASYKRSLADDCRSRMAKQCSMAGMYTEALTLLKEVRRGGLDRQGLIDYFIANNHVFGELGAYSKLSDASQMYFKKATAYKDSLYNVLGHDDDLYLAKRENDYIDQKDYAGALKVNDVRLAAVKEGTHEYAIVSYFRYLIYSKMDNEQMAKYWLTQSAINDVENAIMDQASLWTLADVLSKEGDTNRSYSYITFAWNAAQTFGTRVRNWQISPILNVVDANYQKEIKTTNKELRYSIFVVSLLSLLLLSLLVYVYKQKNRLAVARNDLKKSNGKLNELNQQLSIMNDELDQNNKQLHYSNRMLNESNRVKEEYIGRFIGLCSLYIDKMDTFRKQVNKMIKNKHIEELYNMTMSTEQKDKEVDELYENFDSVFLHLFPNFVADLNTLLREQDRIHLADETKLTTPVRVFALIRLGIDDSSKIADFLHYSVNTIYNYRAKIKNGALGDRNDFERQVKELGTPSD